MRSKFVSPLSALRLELGAPVTLAASLILQAGVLAQQAVQIPYSTHDWTVWPGGELGPYAEAWADVKTPGDGRQYTVGTIEVRHTGTGASFSGSGAEPVSGAPAFTLVSPAARRQVVMLQCTDASQTIVWQRYFYGLTFGDTTRASNARAVAVWPTDDPSTTRIAIAGET